MKGPEAKSTQGLRQSRIAAALELAGRPNGVTIHELEGDIASRYRLLKGLCDKRQLFAVKTGANTVTFYFASEEAARAFKPPRLRNPASPKADTKKDLILTLASRPEGFRASEVTFSPAYARGIVLSLQRAGELWPSSARDGHTAVYFKHAHHAEAFIEAQKREKEAAKARRGPSKKADENRRKRAAWDTYILDLARRPEGVWPRGITGWSYAPAQNRLDALRREGLLFVARIGPSGKRKRYFSTLAAAKAFELSNAKKSRPDKQSKGAKLLRLHLVKKRASVGPAYLPGEPDFSKAKTTYAPAPKLGALKTNTYSPWG